MKKNAPHEGPEAPAVRTIRFQGRASLHRADPRDLRELLVRAQRDSWVEDCIVDAGAGSLTLGLDRRLAARPESIVPWRRRLHRIRRG